MSWWSDNGYQAPAAASGGIVNSQVTLPTLEQRMASFQQWQNDPARQARMNDPAYQPGGAYYNSGVAGPQTGSFTTNDPSGSGFYPYDPNAPQARPQPVNGGFVPPGYVSGATGGPEVRGGTPTPPPGNDPNAIRQWVVQQATAMGKPEIANNPDYWVGEIQKVGGVGDGKYWSDKMANPGGGGGIGSVASGSFLQPFSGSFSAPYQVPQFSEPFTEQFQAPTGLNFQNDPGYQERLKAGQEAMQNSAAAKGTLLTGSFQRDLNEAAQNFASNEYSNVFNRALQGYGADINRYNTNLAGYGASLAGNNQAYNQALGAFGTNYDIFRNNQNDPYSKLYGLAGLGLNATGQANAAGNAFGNQTSANASSYGNLATGYANNAGNIGMNLGNVNAANTAAQFGSLNAPLSAFFDWYQNRQSNNTPPPLSTPGYPSIPGTGY